MALFDFIKNAGNKLFGMGKEVLNDQQKAQKLQEHLQSLNLGIANPQVRVQGDKVALLGESTSQEAVEKAILALGNVNGISQVETQIAQDKASAFYTVKSGDTLSKIAKEVYGNVNGYMRIFEANRPMLKHPDEIYPGQKLRIPGAQAKAA